MQNNNNEQLINEKITALVKVWIWLVKVDLADGAMFCFNKAIATKAITHYMSDLEILKIRYGIKDRAQHTKIAGLMANAVLKYRPIVPMKGSQTDIEEFKANELLAICHGIFVCAESPNINAKIMKDFFTNAEFKDWADKFMYLLREHNYTAESLIMVYETLCVAARYKP